MFNRGKFNRQPFNRTLETRVAILAASCEVAMDGIGPVLLNILNAVAGEVVVHPHGDVNLAWIARTAAAGLNVEAPAPTPIISTGGIKVEAPAPTIKEILTAVPTGIDVDAFPPSVCFVVLTGTSPASLSGIDPKLQQVLHFPVAKLTARADYPMLLFRAPADTCGLAASLVAPSVGYKAAAETAGLSVSFVTPWILETICAVTAETLLEGIPARVVYDMLIRAVDAGISCIGVEPRVYCAGWDRIDQEPSAWTRIK